MLGPRRAIAGTVSKDVYICLHCRLQAQHNQQKRRQSRAAQDGLQHRIDARRANVAQQTKTYASLSRGPDDASGHSNLLVLQTELPLISRNHTKALASKSQRPDDLRSLRRHPKIRRKQSPGGAQASTAEPEPLGNVSGFHGTGASSQGIAGHFTSARGHFHKVNDGLLQSREHGARRNEADENRRRLDSNQFPARLPDHLQHDESAVTCKSRRAVRRTIGTNTYEGELVAAPRVSTDLATGFVARRVPTSGSKSVDAMHDIVEAHLQTIGEDIDVCQPSISCSEEQNGRLEESSSSGHSGGADPGTNTVQSRTPREEPGSNPRNDSRDETTLEALSKLEIAVQDSTACASAALTSDLGRSHKLTRIGPAHTREPQSLRNFAWDRSRTPGHHLSSLPCNGQARLYHVCARLSQQATAVVEPETDQRQPPPSFQGPSSPVSDSTGIRAQLRQWHKAHGQEDIEPELVPNDDVADEDAPVNSFTRLPDENGLNHQEQEEAEKERFAHFAAAGREGFDGNGEEGSDRFLKMGDLVEIEFPKSQTESVLAVFVRNFSRSRYGQFFTMQGRWMHIPPNKGVQYSISKYIPPELVEPLLEHLPAPKSVSEMKGLADQAFVEDLDVPRAVAAPLVQKMVDFFNESQEIYRRHASALDDAHNILAHETDLRYGSLVSAATTLLKLPSNKLPVTALYTVRKALSHSGFAFNIDRRSHRLTGYMQIRSKDQVKMMDTVRGWLRQWQEDLAATTAMDQRRLSRHKPARGAQLVHDFVRKSTEIVKKQRHNRQPTEASNVGPSNVRIPITKSSEAMRVTTGHEFSPADQEILRFLEAWCCSQMFLDLPRIESLPPLVLQATGLYDRELTRETGFMFLQELGTIMPYENRVRFDQHLLLPSSQHSKPLQNLMMTIVEMKDNHNFQDSMAHLRHDWKDLPVYCIDSASALEIDDGISVEKAGVDAQGRDAHWIHVHIANPTAFFSRDHPLAKMARHMGETIYMPDRAYVMLPRWASQKHFSLAPDRPCLTFSAKLDADGNTVEHKITSGIVRNVIRLTPTELEQILGEQSEERYPELTLTVGGEVPAWAPKRPMAKETPDIHGLALQTMKWLAELRANLRKKAGGVFFDSHRPEINVWSSSKRPGLAWEHPYRKGSRTVEGDPVIEMKTRGLINWFTPSTSAVDVLVREFMLLACEISASWCAERKIPAIFRGTSFAPDAPDPNIFWRENVAPAQRPDGSFPLHLGIEFIRHLGYTALRTSPQKHNFLGMDHYTKVTSPLRRYGDMILHWQIEAALRHEAETGKSLAVAPDASSKHIDRSSILPFSAPVLETIMVGLQPREVTISRAKAAAEAFWIFMLLFRKFYFNEDGGLPWLGAGSNSNGPPLRVFVFTDPDSAGAGNICNALFLELNCQAVMYQPKEHSGLGKVQQGDVWEVKIASVNVYKRCCYVDPIRLVGREGAGIL